MMRVASLAATRLAVEKGAAQATLPQLCASVDALLQLRSTPTRLLYTAAMQPPLYLAASPLRFPSHASFDASFARSGSCSFSTIHTDPQAADLSSGASSSSKSSLPAPGASTAAIGGPAVESANAGESVGDSGHASGGSAGAFTSGGGSATFTGSRQGEEESESEGDEDEDEGDARRQQILDAALKHVAALGWSTAALQAGARDCRMSPAAAGLVSGGAADLLQHFQRAADRAVMDDIASRAVGWGNMRIRERIAYAVKTRLLMNAPYIGSWPQALSLQATPSAAPAALTRLAEHVDDVWRTAGDTSTDYNWYTKRALLAGVYTSTELFMLTDYSPDYADTWESLERRIDDVMTVGKAASQAGKLLSSLASNLSETLGRGMPGTRW